jgi:hypothetical protein
MPFVSMPLAGAIAREAVADGKYDLRIEDAVLVASTNHPGQTNTRVRISVLDAPNAKSIFHYMAGFAPDDDEEAKNNKKLMAIAFLNTFGVDWNDEGFELEDLPGSTADGVQLKQEEYEGTIQNKLVIPW